MRICDGEGDTLKFRIESERWHCVIHLNAIVAQYGLAIVQPVYIVHRMARNNALELCILVHINGLHLRLQMRCQRSCKAEGWVCLSGCPAGV